MTEYFNVKNYNELIKNKIVILIKLQKEKLKIKTQIMSTKWVRWKSQMETNRYQMGDE